MMRRQGTVLCPPDSVPESPVPLSPVLLERANRKDSGLGSLRVKPVCCAGEADIADHMRDGWIQCCSAYGKQIAANHVIGDDDDKTAVSAILPEAQPVRKSADDLFCSG